MILKGICIINIFAWQKTENPIAYSFKGKVHPKKELRAKPVLICSQVSPECRRKCRTKREPVRVGPLGHRAGLGGEVKSHIRKINCILAEMRK